MVCHKHVRMPSGEPLFQPARAVCWKQMPCAVGAHCKKENPQTSSGVSMYEKHEFAACYIAKVFLCRIDLIGGVPKCQVAYEPI